jgi:hypothetical protein
MSVRPLFYETHAGGIGVSLEIREVIFAFIADHPD